MNRFDTPALPQPGTPQFGTPQFGTQEPGTGRSGTRGRRRSLLVAGFAALLLLTLGGCGAHESQSAAGGTDSEADSGESSSGRPDGVDSALVDAEPGDCLDAYSVAETYDNADAKDCDSDEAFLVVSYRTQDLDCEAEVGDYEAVNVGDARLCVRLNTKLGECWDDGRVDCDTSPAAMEVMGVGSADDESCGMEPVDDSYTMADQNDWGQATEELTYVYPKDDLRLCILDHGIASMP